jgi:hypothetical protein
MIILENALLFTLNPRDEPGRFSLLVGEDRIIDITRSIYPAQQNAEQTKLQKWFNLYPDAEIIDCRNKMIMPSLVNSCVKSDGVLIKYLLRNRHYENTDGDLCTDFIFNYLYQEFQTEEMRSDINNLLTYSFIKNLKSGVGMMNEVTLRKDMNHLKPVQDVQKLTGQKVSICYPIRQDYEAISRFSNINPSYYLTDEGQMTIYDISMINELRSRGIKRLILEVSTNKDVTEKFRRIFNKPVIKLLDEYNLIDDNTSLINPLYLTYDEIKILSEKKANIIICPEDLASFSNRYFPFDEILNHNVRYSIATGWLGDDLLEEAKQLKNKYKELNISSYDLLRSITRTPKQLFFSGELVDREEYSIAPNKPADLLFIDLSDLRFQLYPESFDFNHMCDFIIDNLSAYNISDVMINGDFKVREHRLVYSSEEDVITASEHTRTNLYKAGKYEELSVRKKQRADTEKLGLKNREEEEIKLFSEDENPDESTVAEGKAEFRIKGKIPVFRQRIPRGQKNLFDEEDTKNIIQAQENPDTPVINLLYTEVDQSKSTDEEITYSKIADAQILKYSAQEKKEQSTSPESKIELPKDVKLKFGDD